MSEGVGIERKRSNDGDAFRRGDFKKPRTDKPPCTLRVLVRNRDAGSIIGKGGENIKRLRKEHDCQVMLPDTQGSPERVLTIMGRQEGCCGVIKDVLTGLPDNEGKLGDKETQILIPQPYMGTIIGTGGSKVNELRRRTKAIVKIFPEAMPGSNERSIQLVGGVDPVSECIWSFLDDISKKDTPREMIYLYEPGNVDEYDAPPFYNDSPRNRGHRGRGGDFRDTGRGRGYVPRSRGGPPFNPGFKHPNSGPPRPPLTPPQNPPMLVPPARGNPPPPVGMAGPPPTGINPPLLPGLNPPRPLYNTSQPPPALVPTPQSAAIPTGGGSVGYTPAPVGYSTPTSNYQPAPLLVPPVGQQPSPYQPPAGVSQYMPPGAQMTPPTTTPPVQQSSQQVTIPLNYAEAILGPGGGRLEGIKVQSACQISINPPNLGTNEQIITIVGSAQGIKMAQELMQNSVRQFHPNV